MRRSARVGEGVVSDEQIVEVVIPAVGDINEEICLKRHASKGFVVALEMTREGRAREHMVAMCSGFEGAERVVRQRVRNENAATDGERNFCE